MGKRTNLIAIRDGRYVCALTKREQRDDLGWREYGAAPFLARRERSHAQNRPSTVGASMASTHLLTRVALRGPAHVGTLPKRQGLALSFSPFSPGGRDQASRAEGRTAGEPPLLIPYMPSAYGKRIEPSVTLSLRSFRYGSLTALAKVRSVAPLCPACLRDICRWPSWVFACVAGTNLAGVLGGTTFFPVLPALS